MTYVKSLTVFEAEINTKSLNNLMLHQKHIAN